MTSKERTTYVLLERGTEDKALLLELQSVLVPTTLEIAKRYPKLLELKQLLRDEMEE